MQHGRQLLHRAVAGEFVEVPQARRLLTSETQSRFSSARPLLTNLS